MTKKQLIAKAKLRIRKTSKDMLDEDVGQLVEVALADLKRIGVHSSYLDEADIKDPLIIEAVLLSWYTLHYRMQVTVSDYGRKVIGRKFNKRTNFKNTNETDKTQSQAPR